MKYLRIMEMLGKPFLDDQLCPIQSWVGGPQAAVGLDSQRRAVSLLSLLGKADFRWTQE